jgi:hypothetical protein
MIRLSGWIRIAIVLSVIWTIGGTAYVFWEEQQREDTHHRMVLGVSNDCLKRNFDRIDRGVRPLEVCPGADEIATTVASARPSLFPKVLFPALALIPLWILGGLLFLTVRWTVQWVRKGFEPG